VTAVIAQESTEQDERQAKGRAARQQLRRSAQAGLRPADGRPDPLTLLAAQDNGRLDELVPIRYGRMAASPFSFYRGAAAVMADDLAATPNSGLVVQACGDAHLSNFGLFGSAERDLVFDINDFDETTPGPWEWDVKRLAASLEVAARELGFGAAHREEITKSCGMAYRNSMNAFAGQSTLEVWYAKMGEQAMLGLADQLTSRARKRTSKELAKARTRDSHKALTKLTAVVEGKRQITSDPPLVVPLDELLGAEERDATVRQLQRLLRDYRRTLSTDRGHLLDQYRLADVAHKVVGVGSVGTRCWILLMLGLDHNDPLFLQAKEATSSVLERYAGPSKFSNHGQRVVAGQRLMQATGDIFLGWQRMTGRDGATHDYYVRQLRDWKGSIDVSQMVPSGLRDYGRLCGWTLARAHARSGDRVAIAAYLGQSDAFDKAIHRFARHYADRNERDHEELVKAIAVGRIPAETGV
jgi:uncharacterized protein (DUF2252 family)